MKKRKEASTQMPKCFVLMPFGPPFDSYYEQIFQPAIKTLELRPVRADKELFRPSPIMSDIWDSIKTAKVLLADLSGRNPNVFYELGLAHAIGKPVVLVASTMEDVPFDLRALRILIYDKNVANWGAKLRSQIKQALLETVVDTEGAVPAMFLAHKQAKRALGGKRQKTLSDLLILLRTTEKLAPASRAALKQIVEGTESRNVPETWHDPSDLRERFRGV